MRNNKTVLYMVVGLIVIVGVVLATQLHFGFRVTRVRPSPGQMPTSTPYIDISFSETIAQQDLANKVVANPSIIKKIDISDKKLRIYVLPLTDQAKYTIQITNLQSDSGSALKPYTIEFTARYIPDEQLPRDIRQAILDNQQGSKGELSDPILSHLPYGGLHFSLTVVVTSKDGKQAVVLESKLLLDKSDLSDREAAINQYKKDTVDYIKSLGLDPQKYTINYTVVEPDVY